MDQVFTFNKSYQERLQEFLNVLGGSKTVSVYELKKEWSYYLELTMDPNGWQAIWKIPRLYCEELDIEYPTMVLVYVDDINFEELTAVIRVLAVQNDIVLPSKYNVPLIQLSITKEQDNSVGLNLEATAHCLDMLHFFYTHLVMPWDYDEECNADWLNRYLNSRLRLFYDMNNGTISKTRSDQLKCLLTKAHRLQAYRYNLESKIEECENNDDIQKLLDIHVSLALIRGEVEILGNPVFQNIDVESLDESQPKKLPRSNIINWVVFEQSNTVDDQIAFLKLVRPAIDINATVRPICKLVDALQFVDSGDSILFNKGTNEIMETIRFPNGITVKGLYLKNETVISACHDDILIDSFGSLLFENLTLDVRTAQCGLLVRSGSVVLKNCTIVGDGKTSTHQGIIVLAGSKLTMINCDISNFYTAIVGNSTSAIALENCNVSNVTQGLKIFDQCTVQVERVLFSNCKGCAVYVVTDEALNNVSKAGSFSLLEGSPELNLKQVTGKNNGKEVVITHKAKLKPITELFSNPALDPTIIHDSDDEMNINISNDSDVI